VSAAERVSKEIKKKKTMTKTQRLREGETE
jgi:hypothetical protein